MLYTAVVASLIACTAAFQAGAPLPMAPATARAAQLVMAAKQTPHGGTLIDLFVPEGDSAAVAASADKTIDITERQSCDVELLCNGGLSPLKGFLNEDEYTGVVETMKPADGNILGLPIVMDTDDESVAVGQKLLLKFGETDMALMTVESKWKPDKPVECVKCYGVGTIEHPVCRAVSTVAIALPSPHAAVVALD